MEDFCLMACDQAGWRSWRVADAASGGMPWPRRDVEVFVVLRFGRHHCVD